MAPPKATRAPAVLAPTSTTTLLRTGIARRQQPSAKAPTTWVSSGAWAWHSKWRARVSPPTHKYKRIYIFTDSQFALGIVTGGWRSRTHATLAKKLKLMVRSLPIPVVISWVPAHCGIDSNERADELADRGALKSSRHGQDVNATTDFTTDDFVPRHYDG